MGRFALVKGWVVKKWNALVFYAGWTTYPDIEGKGK